LIVHETNGYVQQEQQPLGKERKASTLDLNCPAGNAMDTPKRKVKGSDTWQEKEFGCPAAIKMYTGE